MEIDKLAFICIRDRKLLFTRSIGKDVFYIPGGKREAGESDLAALSREVKEELSVDIIAPTVKFYGVFRAQAHGKAEGIVVKMTCYTAEFTGTLAPASEIAHMAWLTSADIDHVPPVDKLILADLRARDRIG